MLRQRVFALACMAFLAPPAQAQVAGFASIPWRSDRARIEAEWGAPTRVTTPTRGETALEYWGESLPVAEPDLGWMMVFTLSESGLVSGHYSGLYHSEADSKQARTQLYEIVRARYALIELPSCGVYKDVSGFTCTSFLDSLGFSSLVNLDELTDTSLELLNSLGGVMIWSKPDESRSLWETRMLYFSMQFFYDWSQRTAMKF